MIHDIIPLIAADLNDFLESRFDTDEDPVIMSNLVNQDGTLSIMEENKVIITLVNVERDGTNQAFGGGFARGDMPVHINLYVLFSAYFSNYAESLKFLSGVIAYFQANPNYMLDGNTIKIELYNPDFREISNLWTAIGAKYLPSAIYKIRTLNMDEDNINDEIPPIGGDLSNDDYY
ncbi:MAG: hypothetical protein ACI85O_000345 [Saprospiraceae bacterium]|jgi:hypothetical protein